MTDFVDPHDTAYLAYQRGVADERDRIVASLNLIDQALVEGMASRAWDAAIEAAEREVLGDCGCLSEIAARIRELRRSRDVAWVPASDLETVIRQRDAAEARAAKLDADLAIAREALEYYAEPQNWYLAPVGKGTECGWLTGDKSRISRGITSSAPPMPTGGKRAREALAALKEEEAE